MEQVASGCAPLCSLVLVRLLQEAQEREGAEDHMNIAIRHGFSLRASGR
jgi:hypothetical protein